MKLTKPQLELLTHAVAAGQASCNSNYAPAKKLIALGMATGHEGKWGGFRLKPTAAGAEHLRTIQ